MCSPEITKKLNPDQLDRYYYQRLDTLKTLSHLAFQQKDLPALGTVSAFVTQIVNDDHDLDIVKQKIDTLTTKTIESCTQIVDFEIETDILEFEHLCEELIKNEADTEVILDFCKRIQEKKYIDMAPLTIYKLLGDCYHYLGEDEKAADAWETYRILDENLKTYAQELGQLLKTRNGISK